MRGVGHVDDRSWSLAMKVLDPLVYCSMKFVDRDGGVTGCGYFAGERLKGMAFCEACIIRVKAAVDDEGVEFVPDLYEPATPRKKAG